MKGTKVAARYAKSLLELALEKGNLDAVVNDMRYLRQVTAENHALEVLFNSPIVPATKKIEAFKEVFGQFEALSLSFLTLITNKGRENFMPTIAQSFLDMVKEHKGIVPVELITAVALDEATRNNIMAKIEASVKGTLEVTETIDPDIIGGFIVNMGDRRIDASVKSQFNKLKQSLTH